MPRREETRTLRGARVCGGGGTVVPALFALAIVGVFFGCRPSGGQNDDGRLQVAVSVLPQAWLVEQIGGEHVDVVPIVKPGVSPATYQPSDAEVSRVMASDIYFRIGVPFERGPWFQAIQASQKLEIVDTRGDIALRDMESHVHHDEDEQPHGENHGADDAQQHVHDDEHGHACSHCDGKDPHIWLSPKLLQRQAEIVAAALGKADPAHRDVYDGNLVKLKKELAAVDNKIRGKLQPFAGKAFFVFHPAWGYFADEYGLRQIAIETEGKEPSDSELTRLQVQGRQAGARVIFVQPQISSQAAEAVAKAIGGRVEQLDPLAEDVATGLAAAADAIAASFE
jgi:zinc transport system substrate-binding protein